MTGQSRFYGAGQPPAGGRGGRGKPTQRFSCSMPARPNRTPRTSPHLFLFTMITLPAVKVTVQKPNRKSKRRKHLRSFVWFLANHLILKSFLFQNRLFQIHLAMTHVARCEIASGRNLPHYLVDKSQTWGGDSGSPNSPKRGEPSMR